ncbi:MAG: ADP-ribosylglycohydrolase family protein [Gemmataceae bacterium]
MAPDAHPVAGAILGCAVGDALGLPYEGLSRRRGVRLLGPPDRHRFLFGRGMVSDDTEHTCMVAQSLCDAPADPDAFARHLARRLRWWLLGVPAGIGFATLRAVLKLWLGFPPGRSGVFSAGNGPAMRSGVLGAAIDDVEALRAFVAASTRVTHTDPKAYRGAFAVALAAWCAKRGLHDAGDFLARCRGDDEFDALLARVGASLSAGETTEAFAEKLGGRRGVSGYVYQTVPVALHAWLSHPRDYRAAVTAVIRCGGDADTTAAIVGSVVGAGVGREGIPPQWLDGLWEWPRTVGWMQRLADAVRAGGRPPGVVPLVGLARNGAFVAAVLGHVARRALPPY